MNKDIFEALDIGLIFSFQVFSSLPIQLFYGVL